MKNSLQDQIRGHYKKLVASKYPEKLAVWPLVAGCNSKGGQFGSWFIIYFDHTANPSFVSHGSAGAITEGVIGFPEITEANKHLVRANLERHFSAKPKDAVLIINSQQAFIDDELKEMLKRHEFAMGLIPMKIFLSHKGADKPLVREFKQTLHALGFDPWLDEDAMHAGVELERGILKGFKDSCAAVFFVTSNFKDESFIASEVNYAIAEKRAKGDRFAIITIVFGAGGVVPDLLRPYVWKEPANEMEAFREILRALPICPGPVHWK